MAILGDVVDSTALLLSASLASGLRKSVSLSMWPCKLTDHTQLNTARGIEIEQD